MKRILKNTLPAVLALSIASILPFSADACTRVVYLGSDNVVITGRTMDWSQDMQSNLWLFPRGMQRNGAAGTNSISWTSKYGSVVTSIYEAGSVDGMNEKALVVNALYLVESQYGQPDNKIPQLSSSAWAQYVLDNFSTVAEAVDALSKEPFQISAPTLPNGAPAQAHLSISDSTGDSAIFEYIEGKLMIHHGKQYQVMTNSPKFDSQLAINTYWESVGGLAFLPGTNRASDRFARASFFVGAVPKAADPSYITAVPEGSYANQAVASVTSIMRSVSVPLGMTTPNQPNVASTLWRTIADQKNKIYYFDSATSPNTFWVRLSELNFNVDAPVKKLTMTGGKIFSGDASSQFVAAKPFVFLPVSTPK